MQKKLLAVIILIFVLYLSGCVFLENNEEQIKQNITNTEIINEPIEEGLNASIQTEVDEQVNQNMNINLEKLIYTNQTFNFSFEQPDLYKLVTEETDEDYEDYQKITFHSLEGASILTIIINTPGIGFGEYSEFKSEDKYLVANENVTIDYMEYANDGDKKIATTWWNENTNYIAIMDFQPSYEASKAEAEFKSVLDTWIQN